MMNREEKRYDEVIRKEQMGEVNERIGLDLRGVIVGTRCSNWGTW
jgi:hypothetical protein